LSVKWKSFFQLKIDLTEEKVIEFRENGSEKIDFMKKHSKIKQMKIKLLLLIFMILGFSSFGTPQKMDLIIYEGKEFKCFGDILDDYFVVNPDKKPKIENIPSNLNRGYFATYLIKDKQLFVNNLQIHGGKKYISVVKKVFPGYKNHKLDWYTGLLIIQVENFNENTDKRWPANYISFIILEINQGNLIKTKPLGYKDFISFGERQYQEFKKTTEYRDLAVKIKNEKKYEANVDSIIKWGICKFSSKILVE